MDILRIHNKELYVSVSLASLILVIMALGPGLFGSGFSDYLMWEYKGFELLCHQIPARSFHLSGMPMAVCSRCIGIYGAFLTAWIALPLLYKIKISNKAKINWLIGLIILNLADVFGNYFAVWSNDVVSRLILGAMLGISVAMLFNTEFFQLKKSE